MGDVLDEDWEEFGVDEGGVDGSVGGGIGAGDLTASGGGGGGKGCLADKALPHCTHHMEPIGFKVLQCKQFMK